MAGASDGWSKLRTVALTEAIWAIALYRLGRYLGKAVRALLRGPFALATSSDRCIYNLLSASANRSRRGT